MCRAVTYEYRLKIDIALRLPYVVATSHQELPETAIANSFVESGRVYERYFCVSKRVPATNLNENVVACKSRCAPPHREA